MAGIIYYLIFLILGYCYAVYFFRNEAQAIKLWTGGILGNMLLMCGVIPFAFLFDFGYISHAAILATAAAGLVALFFLEKRRGRSFFQLCRSWQPVFDEGFTPFILLILLGVTVLICLLLINHVMAPVNGGIASGQSTYGDLAMHMGFVTSIAEQKTFPPEYNQLAGHLLGYPFFIDSLSSSLYLLGMPLRWAILLPSFVFVFLLVFGFYFLAYRLTGRKYVSLFAVLFFFLNGGFGFAYFLEGAKADGSTFTRMFTEYYHTPTNYNEENIRWSNTICDMIIPQRTTMAGWTILVFLLYQLYEAMQKGGRQRFVILGILGGAMVMVHTHSFMALAIISAVCFLHQWITKRQTLKGMENWFWYGGIAAVLAVPQMILWTFGNTSNEGFMHLTFNWVNKEDPYLWFWLKNCGVAAIFAVPAFITAKKENRPFIIGCAVIFILAELIVFQPNEYDNNKLFYVVYMFVIIEMCRLMGQLYEKMKGLRIRGYFAALIIFFSTFSGCLTVIREYRSGGEYTTFTDADIAFAEQVRKSTDPNGVFLTHTQHLNPVSVLAGRTVYVGSSLYVYFHGFSQEYSQRSAQAKEIYEARTAEEIQKKAKEAGVSYIVVTPYEQDNYEINMEEMNRLPQAFESVGNRYAVYCVE